MAMNPAAKDSNAFASSNLSGGKADSAILGIPQNQPMPSGPQPTGNPQTPLAQTNNQSFGPQSDSGLRRSDRGAQRPDAAADARHVAAARWPRSDFLWHWPEQ
jgi:hypothetical protein